MFEQKPPQNELLDVEGLTPRYVTENELLANRVLQRKGRSTRRNLMIRFFRCRAQKVIAVQDGYS
jgi:hypothetical protein